mmetsp:Transcript_76853/g.207415  ORF Transcript_76853/g.207415 Transcript_76853/m.207415 type:complete len:421 (-) Transcript_76853:210-1472(-)
MRVTGKRCEASRCSTAPRSTSKTLTKPVTSRRTIGSLFSIKLSRSRSQPPTTHLVPLHDSATDQNSSKVEPVRRAPSRRVCCRRRVAASQTTAVPPRLALTRRVPHGDSARHVTTYSSLSPPSGRRPAPPPLAPPPSDSVAWGGSRCSITGSSSRLSTCDLLMYRRPSQPLRISTPSQCPGSAVPENSGSGLPLLATSPPVAAASTTATFVSRSSPPVLSPPVLRPPPSLRRLRAESSAAAATPRLPASPLLDPPAAEATGDAPPGAGDEAEVAEDAPPPAPPAEDAGPAAAGADGGALGSYTSSLDTPLSCFSVSGVTLPVLTAKARKHTRSKLRSWCRNANPPCDGGAMPWENSKAGRCSTLSMALASLQSDSSTSRGPMGGYLGARPLGTSRSRYSHGPRIIMSPLGSCHMSWIWAM